MIIFKLFKPFDTLLRQYQLKDIFEILNKFKKI